MPSQAVHTRIVKEKALKWGFDYCGIARAVKLDDDARRLETWLKQGYHGSMQYMENHFDLRIDPTLLVPGARSVITVLKNYYPENVSTAELQISKYAYGQDYHSVIRDSLRGMMSELAEAIGPFNGRGFVDSAPVLERSWAQRSGLGWIGKNGNLITKSAGSFFFIATLIVDLDLNYDDPFAKDYCGTCKRCVEACPTEAILPDKTIQGNKCISYFTIELKDELIPQDFKGKLDNWMFGCDVCQDVCPWNRFSHPHQEQAFQPIPEVFSFTAKDWQELQEESFNKLFRLSPLKRSKFKGIQRNIKFLAASKNNTQLQADSSETIPVG